MVLKRIIRQYLNQNFPENIRPTQKLDRKSAKILEDQSYFNDTPLIVRTIRAHRKLKRSRIFPLTSATDRVEHEYSGNLLKIQQDPFFKEIQQSPTFTQSLEKSNVHYQTKLCKDYFLNNITDNINKNIISANQWTGLDINRLTWGTKYYNVWKTRKQLYSLNQYKAALGNKNRRDRSSIYKSQLRERKKLALLYGNLSKKEIYKTIQKAEKYRGPLRDNILRVLESRLDVILYRVGFFKSIPTARQWIIHRKILVNQQVVTIAHYQVKAGDIVSVDPRQACLLVKMIDSRFQEMKEFESYFERAAGLSAEQAAGLSTEQAAGLFTEQAADLSAEQAAGLWPFIADRRGLKKMFKFGIVYGLNKILFLAAKKILENNLTEMKFSRMWKRVRSYQKFLHKQRPIWKRRWVWKKRISFIFRYDKKFFHSIQKFKDNKKFRYSKQKFKDNKKYNQTFLKTKKRLSGSKAKYKREFVSCFETIKELLKMKIIASMAKNEYGFKIRDPLFTYKYLLLLKRKPATPLFKEKDWLKKPLHLEVSYKTLTAVYLYSPQKLFFPVNIDIDAVKKSYY